MALASLHGSRSWILSIFVTDLGMQKSIEVNGQTHVGQVMLDLVDKLDITSDWSDHGVWWPDRKQWLLKPRVTLATVGLVGDCQLHFTPMHKLVRLQMPDLQYLDMRVNFAANVFNAVKEICVELGIRHPEELSLLKPLERSTKKAIKKKKSDAGTGSAGSDDAASQGSIGNGSLGKGGRMPPSSPASAGTRSDFSFSGSDSLNPYATALSPMLTHSPQQVSAEAMEVVQKGKSLTERSVINKGWLFSSESLMAQEVKELDTLILRFKYFNFFDINPKVDEVRINQLYEQARWQILSDELDCTEEEAITFAALMFQVRVAAQSPQSSSKGGDVDDIDSALNDLQMSLEGTTARPEVKPAARPSLTHIPEMKDTLAIVRSKKLGIKSQKQFYFQFRDTHISYFKGVAESMGAPLQKFNLKGCEVTPEVTVAKDKYNIKLRIPGADITDIELGCTSKDQYIRWMAACRLASKGKTMADPSYEVEMAGAKTFISMQGDVGRDDTDFAGVDGSLQPEDLVPSRLLNKYKPKQISARILEAHSGFTKFSLQEAKLNFIRQWQALPDFGLTTFNVKFATSKKKSEIVGIAFNRVVRMDATSREVAKQWRYSTMKAWNVNWETREMMISSEGETINFSCVDCDVRVVHEFIGGYIFLSMRKDVNTQPDDEMFYKLTASGWY